MAIRKTRSVVNRHYDIGQGAEDDGSPSIGITSASSIIRAMASEVMRARTYIGNREHAHPP